MAQATVNRATKRFSPGGAAEVFDSPQMALVEIDAAAMQELQIFLLKGPFPMMLLLSGDVATDVFAVGRADTECAITFLPCKGAVAGLVMHPFRGNRLNVANHIGEAGSGFEAEQEVNMISHAAYSLGDAFRFPRHAAEVGV